MPTPTPVGDPPTLTGSFCSISYWVTAPESWCAQGFVCALRGWSLCFPHSCGSLVIKSCWSSRSDFLRIPRPFVRSPGWEAWRGVPNLHNIGRTSLLLLFSNLWVTQLASMIFDFIMVVPLLPAHCNFFFAFGCGLSFLVGFSVPLMVVQQLVMLLALSQKEMSAHPSTLPSWTYILCSNSEKRLAFFLLCNITVRDWGDSLSMCQMRKFKL